MPIYEYLCEKCNNEFEALVFSNEETPNCPHCKSNKVKKLVSAGSFRPHGIPSGGGGFKLPKCAQSG